MSFLNKPDVPMWVRIVSPLLHGVELVGMFFGFQLITGYPGWYGAALGLAVLCLFELTILPALLLPISLTGLYYMTGLSWMVTLPVLIIPYLYNVYYMRRFRRQQSIMKILRQPRFATKARI